MHDGVFIPHNECTETSGACFTEGRCLGGCRASKRKDHETRIRDLERRTLDLMREIAALKARA